MQSLILTCKKVPTTPRAPTLVAHPPHAAGRVVPARQLGLPRQDSAVAGGSPALRLFERWLLHSRMLQSLTRSATMEHIFFYGNCRVIKASPATIVRGWQWLM